MSSRKSRLAPSKHHLQSTNDPPASLEPFQHIARISKPHGNAIYTVELASKSELLVELPMRFRNAVWVRRGGFVLIATEGFTDGKVGGEIVQVIMDEKTWRKQDYWCASSILLLISGPMSSNERRKVARTRMRWKSQKLDVMLLLREGRE